MSFGTKLRTALRIAVSTQTAVALVSAAVMDTGIKPLMVMWIGFAIACDFAVGWLTTWFNNDYTEIAAEHTGAMRLEKAESNMEGIVGENFLNVIDEIDPDEEDFEEPEGEV